MLFEPIVKDQARKDACDHEIYDKFLAKAGTPGFHPRFDAYVRHCRKCDEVMTFGDVGRIFKNKDKLAKYMKVKD